MTSYSNAFVTAGLKQCTCVRLGSYASTRLMLSLDTEVLKHIGLSLGILGGTTTTCYSESIRELYSVLQRLTHGFLYTIIHARSLAGTLRLPKRNSTSAHDASLATHSPSFPRMRSTLPRSRPSCGRSTTLVQYLNSRPISSSWDARVPVTRAS